ncbi:hypothetical protein TIFTF001_038605, partial [Ficus carica]
ASVYPKTRG